MDNAEDTEEVVLAFCWYDQRQWELAKKLDPNGMDSSYDVWRENANEVMSEFLAVGKKIRKISLNIDKFKEWCIEENLEPNGSSRSEYAAMLAEKRGDRKKHNKVN